MRRVFRLRQDRDPAQAPADVSRELELHIDLRAREFEAAGMSREDARRAALDAFGDREEIEAQVRQIHDATVEERRRRDWLGDLRQDVRVGARMLARSPSFTLVALLTLAIGIGANTAIFGVLRSVLLRPLPYPHPGQLVQLWTDHRALGRANPEWLTPPDYVDWRDQNTTFSAMAAYQGWGPDLTGGGDPESLGGALVSGNFFDMLGARPAIGRLLAMRDDDASAPRVVLLSHAFWERRFGGDPSVIGKPIMLSGVPWTVVGVVSEDFRAPVPIASPEIFAAIRRPSDSRCGRGCIVLRAIGRMRPGVTLAAAQADIARIAAREARDYPETNAKVGAWLVPLHDQITGPARAGLVALSAAVALVLLMGCVNLANLLLVRGIAREREISVRAALGAGRSRVVRQLLAENALLAAFGGVLGLAIGVAGTRVIGMLVPDSIRAVQEIRVDATVLAFAAAVTLAATALFGLVPAVQAARPGIVALRSGAGQTDRHANALRRTLVVTQLAFAVVLLVGAGLLLRSFLVMQRVDLGFRASGVYFTTVFFPPSRYPTGDRALAALGELTSRLRANPAVRRVEVTDLPPLSGGDQDITAIPVGSTPAPGAPPSIWYRAVTPGYLSEMQMRLIEGRALTADDRHGVPLVGIINQDAADKFWPGQDPVGRVLATGASAGAPRMTIVGVVASGRHDGPSQPYKPELFVSMAQFPWRGATLVLEPAGNAASVTAAMRQALHDVDPLVPLSRVTPIEQLIGDAVAVPRLYALLVAAFAGAALLLAALGIYGVMSYAVTQRQREIGVRLALGAAPRTIGRMVLGEGTRLAAAGLVIGIAGALLLGRLLERLLFGVTQRDPATLVLVPLVLGATTLLACWLPARRAMRLDPLIAIRGE